MGALTTPRFLLALLALGAVGCGGHDGDPIPPHDAAVAADTGADTGSDTGTDAGTDAAAGEDGRWEPISLDGAPSPRVGFHSVWTGREMIIWGGVGCLGGGSCEWETLFDDGARYEADSDSWSPLPATGAPSARLSAAHVWAGDRMLLWSGYGLPPKGGPLPPPFDDGAWYVPTTDAWEPVSTEGAPAPRMGARTAWTGSQLLIWGGGVPDDPLVGVSRPLFDGARLDPQSGEWQPMASVEGADLMSMPAFATWAADTLIVWDGRAPQGPRRGWRYDPVTDVWSDVSPHDGPEGSCGVVWTGIELLAFSHASWSRYDPTTDEWTWSASEETLCATPVWTGREVLLWRPSGSPPGAAARFDPATGTTRPIASEGAPAPRSGFAQVWTGEELIIWGGEDEATGTKTSTGYRYRPPQP